MKLGSLLLLVAFAHGQQQGEFDGHVEGLGGWETDDEGMDAFSESAGGIEVIDVDNTPTTNGGQDININQDNYHLPHCPNSLVSFSCRPGTGQSYVNMYVCYS